MKDLFNPAAHPGTFWLKDFRDYFAGIPAEKWQTQFFGSGKECRCAMGHLQAGDGGGTMRAQRLANLLVAALFKRPSPAPTKDSPAPSSFLIANINDGNTPVNVLVAGDFDSVKLKAMGPRERVLTVIDRAIEMRPEFAEGSPE